MFGSQRDEVLTNTDRGLKTGYRRGRMEACDASEGIE